MRQGPNAPPIGFLSQRVLTVALQVIADLYERYIELIGTVKEDGETTSDGYAYRASFIEPGNGR